MKIISDSKTQTFKNVLSGILKLELEKGHLKWKFTDLARVSGVQRTLIYYYFGSDRKELVDAAVKMISEDFFGLPRGKFRRDFVTAISETRKLIEEAPHILQFYLKWRYTSSPIGEQLRNFEINYKSRLKLTFPHLGGDMLDSIFALIFGLVCIPEISPQAIQIATHSLLQIIPESVFR